MAMPGAKSAVLSFAIVALIATAAVAQTAKIVGLGAAMCRQFNHDVEGNFSIQRDYFAWAQGFMSGVLMRAPLSVDDELDVNPTSFPLLKQVEFLRSFCERNPDKSYTDGVEALYRALRKIGTGREARTLRVHPE